MKEIDLHGLQHDKVREELENWLLIEYNKGNFPIRVITGNSLMMKKIVASTIDKIRFKQSNINTHNGSIVVVE